MCVHVCERERECVFVCVFATFLHFYPLFIFILAFYGGAWQSVRTGRGRYVPQEYFNILNFTSFIIELDFLLCIILMQLHIIRNSDDECYPKLINILSFVRSGISFLFLTSKI